MESYVISRIFHPIGQGAFYSEIHRDFNIVYDCGNWKKTTSSESIVKRSFTSKDEIDILFISHFDWDHISRIGTLKDTVKRIKCVIMPLLHIEEKIFITNIHRTLGFESGDLINEPKLFFGEDVKIIFVDSFENPRVSDGEAQEIENISSPMKSGVSVSIGTSEYNWVFIPFNIKHIAREKDLIHKLEQEGFDIDRLKNDPEYATDIIDNTPKKNKVKTIYNSVKGKINQNSMIVYSGCQKPVDAIINWSHSELNNRFYFNHFPFHYFHRYSAVSCVYTGDVDLNFVKLEQVFSKYWEFVGTVQIPHHGSLNDFDASFMNRSGIFCPVSFGKTNTYEHPSPNVIYQIKSKNCFPIEVTEELDSAAVQTIESAEY
jgi:hypothetical protein